MAQRIQLVDDLNPDVDAVATVEFSVRAPGLKRECVLDLGAENVQRFVEDMTRWATPARRPDKPPAVVRQAAERSAPPTVTPGPGVAESAGGRRPWTTPPSTPPSEQPVWKAMRKDGRDWALNNGWPDLGSSGKVPVVAYEAWIAAMGWTGPLFKEWSAWREAGSPPVPHAATSKRSLRTHRVAVEN